MYANKMYTRKERFCWEM